MTTKLAKAQRPKHRKGRPSKRNVVVKEVVTKKGGVRVVAMADGTMNAEVTDAVNVYETSQGVWMSATVDVSKVEARGRPPNDGYHA